MLSGLRRAVAVALVAVAVVLAVAASDRPYADNQRNWLVAATAAAGLTALALVASSPLVHGLRRWWRKVRAEWSHGSQVRR